MVSLHLDGEAERPSVSAGVAHSSLQRYLKFPRCIRQTSRIRDNSRADMNMYDDVANARLCVRKEAVFESTPYVLYVLGSPDFDDRQVAQHLSTLLSPSALHPSRSYE